MEEYFLDQHGYDCPCKDPNYDNDWLGRHCEYNPVRFLFFLKGKFILITYYSCMEMLGKYEFKVGLIKQVIGQNKVYPSYEVQKSVHVDTHLKQFNVDNNALNKWIREVNYLYCDNTGKEYAITTRVRVIDSICSQDEIEENYKAAKKVLEEKEYTWLLDSLNELKWRNRMYQKQPAIYHNTIDQIIKSINQLTK
jgi:hypothetical protein